jgi:hypothetical protein
MAEALIDLRPAQLASAFQAGPAPRAMKKPLGLLHWRRLGLPSARKAHNNSRRCDSKEGRWFL